MLKEITKIIKLLLCVFTFEFYFAGFVYAEENKDVEWEHKNAIRARIYQDIADNNELEDDVATDLLFESDNSLWFMSRNLLFKADIEGRIETFEGYDSATDSMFRIKEGYAQFTKDTHTFTAGEKIVTWGKMDDVVILDRINPQDFTRFILEDKQDRKLSALMFKYDYSPGDWKIESIFKPFFKPSAVNYFGSDWAVFGNLKQGVSDGNMAQAKKDIVSAIAVEEQDYVTDNNLKNSEAGLRLTNKFNALDYSFYYMNIRHALPVLKERTATGNLVKQYLYDPSLANLNALEAANPSGDDYILERAHPRLNVVGADWETVIGGYGARGEIGMFWGQPYLREDFSYVEKDVLSFGLGIDHTTANDIYIDFQFIADYVMDYEGLFAQEEIAKQFTGSVSKNFKRGIINLNLDWAYSLSYQDLMLNPVVEYKFINGLSVSFGSFMFMGDSTTTFGAFNSKDLIYAEMKYLF